MCISGLGQPAYGKKRLMGKNTRNGEQCRLQRQATGASVPHIPGKFQESANLVIIFFQSLLLNALRPINSQFHYSREKGQGKNEDYYFGRSSTVLLGKKWWLMLFIAPQIFFCVCCFLHMYTLNSCHFFLYLLWIFKKCYQSTCFTVFLLSFPFSFFHFTVGLREAWVRSLKLIR